MTCFKYLGVVAGGVGGAEVGLLAGSAQGDCGLLYTLETLQPDCDGLPKSKFGQFISN